MSTPASTDASKPTTGATGAKMTTGERAAIPMALFLWVLVTLALAYGVVQTLAKVVQLFG